MSVVQSVRDTVWNDVLPEAARERLRPIVRRVRFGSLRRVTPFSEWYGLDRGTPVDRWYIERFLVAHRQDITGRVLEVEDNHYTTTFGGDRVTSSDVLFAPLDEIPPGVTIVADLNHADSLPPAAFDCIIFTQVLQFISDVDTALANVRRALAPGGTLLMSVPGISQICREDEAVFGEYWRFTSAAVRMLLERQFAAEQIVVEPVGNPLTATGFLYGLAAEELRVHELEANHPDYELIICARATAAEI